MLRFGLLSRGANLPSAHRLAYYRANSLTDSDANEYDITAVSHPSDTVLTPGHTYSLNVGLWAALGGIDGVDHWAFTSVGVPKVVSYETIMEHWYGPAMYSGDKGVAVYSPKPIDAIERKIWKYLKGHTFQALTIDGDQLFIDGEPLYEEVV